MDDFERAKLELLMTVANVIAKHPDLDQAAAGHVQAKIAAVENALPDHEPFPERRYRNDPSLIPGGVERRRASKMRTRIKGRPAPAGS